MESAKEGDLDISKEIPIELLQTGIKVTEKEVQDHSYLTLEVKPIFNFKEIEGNMLNGNKLKINAKGLINGLRGEEDGICFLGDDSKKDVITL